MKPLMQCGHTAQGEMDGKPVCVICVGIGDLDAKARTVDDAPPSLEGRRAKCPDCGAVLPSNWGRPNYALPFFEYTGKEYDRYYCGCRGWD